MMMLTLVLEYKRRQMLSSVYRTQQETAVMFLIIHKGAYG